MFGDRWTGTPSLGFWLAGGARDYRLGWRLAAAVAKDSGLEVTLDARRREADGDEPPEHGVTLRAGIRW